MARRESRGAPRRTNARQYPRTARLNQLMREIVAEALEHIDDERLDLLTVTAVEVEPDLRHALVYYDSLQGADGDPEVLEALADQRKVLQAAIGREARIKRTPELAFAPDPAVRQGALVETLLAEVAPGAVEVVVDPDLYDDPDLADG
jgi:ribosome-binding factor A